MQDFGKLLMISRAGKTIFRRLRPSEPIVALTIQNFVLDGLIILIGELSNRSFGEDLLSFGLTAGD
jgi:hypothetical protein